MFRALINTGFFSHIIRAASAERHGFPRGLVILFLAVSAWLLVALMGWLAWTGITHLFAFVAGLV